jgi:hypothetical protein
MARRSFSKRRSSNSGRMFGAKWATYLLERQAKINAGMIAKPADGGSKLMQQLGTAPVNAAAIAVA